MPVKGFWFALVDNFLFDVCVDNGFGLLVVMVIVIVVIYGGFC